MELAPLCSYSFEAKNICIYKYKSFLNSISKCRNENRWNNGTAESIYYLQTITFSFRCNESENFFRIVLFKINFIKYYGNKLNIQKVQTSMLKVYFSPYYASQKENRSILLTIRWRSLLHHVEKLIINSRFISDFYHYYKLGEKLLPVK